MGPLSRAMRKASKSIELKNNLLTTCGKLDLPEQKPEMIHAIRSVRAIGFTLYKLGVHDTSINLVSFDLSEAKDYTEKYWPAYKRWLNWDK